jgi:hypothetical protein
MEEWEAMGRWRRTPGWARALVVVVAIAVVGFVLTATDRHGGTTSLDSSAAAGPSTTAAYATAESSTTAVTTTTTATTLLPTTIATTTPPRTSSSRQATTTTSRDPNACEWDNVGYISDQPNYSGTARNTFDVIRSDFAGHHVDLKIEYGGSASGDTSVTANENPPGNGTPPGTFIGSVVITNENGTMNVTAIPDGGLATCSSGPRQIQDPRSYSSSTTSPPAPAS